MRIKTAGLPFRSDSVADPLVAQCRERAAFAFLATRPKTDRTSAFGMVSPGGIDPPKSWHDCGIAIFRSDSVLLLRHGHPNDEARPGHPLYSAEADAGVLEIEDSPWLDEVVAINAVKFPASRNRFGNVRHHFFPFKETTLEVLWTDFFYEHSERPFLEISESLVQWVLQERGEP